MSDNEVRLFYEAQNPSREMKRKDARRIFKNYWETDHGINFQICSVSNLSAQNALTEHMHVDSYEFVYMFRGKQSYTIDGTDQLVSAGELVISAPNVCHTSGIRPQEKSNFYYVTVGKEVFSELFGAYPDTYRNLLDTLTSATRETRKVHKMKKASRIQQVCETLLTLHGSDDPFLPYRVRNAISELLLLTMDSILSKPGEIDAPTDGIEPVKSYIDSHLCDNLSVDEMALMSNYSRSAFAKRFKQHTGLTVHEYILQQKIKQARTLLLTMSPEAVSRALAFSSERYFSEVFKRYTTVTPMRYKKGIPPRRGIE